jgi:putative component of membrane protein insertase Oxa1/YidC/SpoIIIJ protein YidD
VLVWLAKKSIEYYWNTVPEKKRKICIYRITCSRFVYNEFHNNGFIPGLLAYFYRMKSCNHGYTISLKKNMVIIKDSQGHIIEENEINPLIVNEFKNS